MAGNTSALLKGFDYQHLLSWYHILSLKTNSDVVSIKLENVSAGNVDDLTVEKQNGFIDFYQVKYHVSGGYYSMDSLFDAAASGPSLMEKFWNTWQSLIKVYPKNKIRLILYSNWVYHAEDKVLVCIDGENGHLTDLFFSAGDRSGCGKERTKWKKRHAASDADFSDFAKSISFQLGRNNTEELKQMISDRMRLCGLKADENAMKIAVGIVKDWIKDKEKQVSVAMLDEEIKNHDLIMPATDEKSVSVYFSTIKDRKFDLEPDYSLDWRHYFKEVGGMGGHELLDESKWNSLMLPELRTLEDRINKETTAKLVRARGFARLSAWFAIGHTFSAVSGYAIEIDQLGKLWRTDASPSSAFKVISENGAGEKIGSGNKTVAVGISVSGSLETDVRKYVASTGCVDAVLFLRPESDLGQNCFTSAADVTAFAQQAKVKLREFAQLRGAQRLLLFYFGPLSGACFLGHQLNAICPEIQIMENFPGGGYNNAFLLS